MSAMDKLREFPRDPNRWRHVFEMAVVDKRVRVSNGILNGRLTWSYNKSWVDELERIRPGAAVVVRRALDEHLDLCQSGRADGDDLMQLYMTLCKTVGELAYPPLRFSVGRLVCRR